MDIQLSILICSLPDRAFFLLKLLNILNPQIVNKPVELLILTDNKTMKIGEKRNKLIEMAKGKYITFIDDDDIIEPDYVENILSKIQYDPDCIVYDVFVRMNGVDDRLCKYGHEFQNINTSLCYFRYPNHLMVHKKENIKNIKFLEVNFGEDNEWATRITPTIKRQERIYKVLYRYEYSSTTSQAKKD